VPKELALITQNEAVLNPKVATLNTDYIQFSALASSATKQFKCSPSQEIIISKDVAN